MSKRKRENEEIIEENVLIGLQRNERRNEEKRRKEGRKSVIVGSEKDERDGEVEKAW